MAADVSVLNILLHGEPIGTLTRVAGDRTLFAFNEDYIDNPNRPTLSLGFKDRLGQLITALRPVQTRVMPFFSNLLPEGHLRRYLAELAGVDPDREFFLLWALGQDLPGAVTVEPADGEAWPPGADEDDRAPDQDRRPNALRFSLAGVQLKFSAVMEASGGLTIPAKGIGGSWVVKLPSREFAHVPENEYSMMTLARLVGINVPPVNLVDVDAIGNLPGGTETLKGQALAVERFDRLPDGTKVHIEDFAQIF
ncbi:MAG: HipA N-terminal domain-containing protein, partial [Woeseia sp.]